MSTRILRQMIRLGTVSELRSRPAVVDLADAADDPDARALGGEIRRLFGRSLAIRAVDSGSCNACELELHALNNPYYNIESLGIRFVASPRHADLLLVTGCVGTNMALALQRTYDAMPEPRRVVAVGDCAKDGGRFGAGYASLGPTHSVLRVDAVAAGCPPTPVDILRAICAAVAR
jgi:Ni,Fe-hydrogenase III small subunit